MELILSLLKTYWKSVVLYAAIGFMAAWGYNYIYDRGAAANDQKWEQRMDSYEKARDEKINNIEGFARTNLEQTLIANEKANRDINTLIAVGKKGPIVVYKDGKCQLTPDFVSTYNAVIDRGNSK